MINEMEDTAMAELSNITKVTPEQHSEKHQLEYLQAKVEGEHLAFIAVQEENNQLKRQVEQQSKYAELGKAVFTVFKGAEGCNCPNSLMGRDCEECEFDVVCDIIIESEKRAELLAGERDNDTVRCSCCGKSLDIERMLTNCDNCGLTMVCDNCYEKHECEWDGE